MGVFVVTYSWSWSDVLSRERRVGNSSLSIVLSVRIQRYTYTSLAPQCRLVWALVQNGSLKSSIEWYQNIFDSSGLRPWSVVLLALTWLYLARSVALGIGKRTKWLEFPLPYLPTYLYSSVIHHSLSTHSFESVQVAFASDSGRLPCQHNANSESRNAHIRVCISQVIMQSVIGNWYYYHPSHRLGNTFLRY